jgi:hypothetical protein
VVDLIASEYGWPRNEIRQLPMDEEARIIHAILFRKGARVFRKNITTEKITKSLADRLAEINEQAQIDIDSEMEGILWHSP